MRSLPFLAGIVCLLYPSVSLCQRPTTPSPTRLASTASTSSSVAPASSAASSTRSPSVTPSASVSASGSASGSSVSASTTDYSNQPPDVHLLVPELSVGRIELDVEELKADINLAANVAQLVSINAGIAVSVQKINITIADVSAELELTVRLGHLVDIVNRVFESLDLNPLLISAIGNVTDLIGSVVGAVDGLLGSITQGGTTLNFLIDNLGNIVQEVVGTAGSTVSTIVGDYLTNMTFTGVTEQLSNGLTQKTYSYAPLNALVDIVFNTLGQVVQATVQKATGSSSSSSAVSTPVATASSSSTAAARR